MHDTLCMVLCSRGLSLRVSALHECAGLIQPGMRHLLVRDHVARVAQQDERAAIPRCLVLHVLQTDCATSLQSITILDTIWFFS